MNKQLVKVGRKNTLLTGSNLWQNHLPWQVGVRGRQHNNVYICIVGEKAGFVFIFLLFYFSCATQNWLNVSTSDTFSQIPKGQMLPSAKCPAMNKDFYKQKQAWPPNSKWLSQPSWGKSIYALMEFEPPAIPHVLMLHDLECQGDAVSS